ncbi:uncharacterized protein LOC134723297 [Mytilus trossulus]|uniref:uncharacterized protein LOC134723297 n=1 Tax=Mytilus trossulus TaxID=6551 RepID=UPI0030046C12
MMFALCFAAIIAVVQSGESDVVAFTKGLVAHAHLTQGDIVTYNKDITNINSVFTSDGKFQVQVPGIYSFHFYSLSRSDSEIWLEFRKNEDYVASIYAYTASDWADAGNTIVLELQAGDTIFVKAVEDYDNSLYGAAGEIYTTFTGELMFSEASGVANPIAFSAGLTKNISLPSGTNVMYDKIITNAGNGFDQTTGDFVVPQDGTYMIHYNSLSELGMEMWLELYLNDQYINSAYGQAPHTWADAGNSAILDMKSGDRLRVRGRKGENIVLYGQPDEIYCIFSGVMLTAKNAPAAGANAGQIQAFAAGLTKNQNNGVTTTKVTWDKVFTDHGDNFNQTNGVFTAKVSGVYVFNYHGMGQQDEEVWLELYHNYVYVNSLYGHATHGWAGGSNSAALYVAQGDTVYVDMKDHSTKMFGDADQIYCTFSGYLLAPMVKGSPVVG